jgi:hypothetical protein
MNLQTYKRVRDNVPLSTHPYLSKADVRADNSCGVWSTRHLDMKKIVGFKCNTQYIKLSLTVFPN